MLHQLRQKEFIRKKIISLQHRVEKNKLLQNILDEYIYLQELMSTKSK
jgi:hypothetical protein